MKSTIHQASLKSLLIAAAATLGLPVSGIAQKPGTTPAAPAAAEAEPESYAPEKYSPLRYRAIYAESAFERDILPPVKEEVIVDEKPIFEMKVVSVTGNDGRYRVTVIDKKGNYVVLTDKPKEEGGYYYSDIKPAANVADVEVQVAKGGHTEWAFFDENRFKIASKGLPAKTPTNTRGRPNVVPTVRRPPGRAPIPQSKTGKAAAEQSGTKAIQAINSATEATKSRSSGRRVVLPPKSR